MVSPHIPVLLNEVIEYIGPLEGARVADLTFGEGGHSEAFLDAGAAFVLGVDQDESALQRYQTEGRFRNDPRLSLVHGPNSALGEFAPFQNLDAVLVDLGVSTRQLLEAERGFSFAQAGPLDMRMDTSTGKETLDAFLNRASEEEIASALHYNAEVDGSRKLARRLKALVDGGELKSTLDLAGLLPKAPFHKTHPATQMFLALRMAVNDELGEIERGLPTWLAALKPGGRLLVISFHSVEDRLVKRSFQKLAGKCVCRESLCTCPRTTSVNILTPKPVVASENELRVNPRSRSAKLRCVEKLSPER